MKYYTLAILLAVSFVRAHAQQPRLEQVDTYLAATGRVADKQPVSEKRYGLLGTFYRDGKSLLLGLPDFSDRGAREVIPFGYRLNPLSEVALEKITGNLAESIVRPMFNKSIFKGVSYLFCDSVVYGINLHYSDQDGIKHATIKKSLDKFFGQADYSRRGEWIYSDPDYAVRLAFDRVEVYSLFHYPIVETRFPGIAHKVWYGPFTYETDGSSLMLAFYNQETKENNIQSAFKVRYTYNSLQPFGMNKICFVLDDITYDFPLEIEIERAGMEGNKQSRSESDTRIFINPEVMKAMLRSKRLEVVLEGKTETFSYKIPAFQRASLYTAYEYFRWNVTNPMVKYKAW